MVKVGDIAPSFLLASNRGQQVSLRELRGRKLVLYFYPKDDTPGCTREACDFRDNLARIQEAGANVFGVSRDSIESHVRFERKYDLPFELLSDPDAAVTRTYGAWGMKTLYGEEREGVVRTTVLIDEEGRLQKVWSPVKVEGHVDEVLAELAKDSGRRKAAKKPAARKKPAASKAGRKKKAAKASTRKKPARARAATPARKRAAATPARKRAAAAASARGKKASKKPSSRRGARRPARKA